MTHATERVLSEVDCGDEPKCLHAVTTRSQLGEASSVTQHATFASSAKFRLAASQWLGSIMLRSRWKEKLIVETGGVSLPRDCDNTSFLAS